MILRVQDSTVAIVRRLKDETETVCDELTFNELETLSGSARLRTFLEQKRKGKRVGIFRGRNSRLVVYDCTFIPGEKYKRIIDGVHLTYKCLTYDSESNTALMRSRAARGKNKLVTACDTLEWIVDL